MAIGRHEPRVASDTTFKQAFAIGLDEALTAVEESIHGLTDEQVATFPVPGENNIAWIVMHTLDNLDDYAVGVATGQRLHPPEWRWDLWQGRPDERPKPGDILPTTQAMLARLREIRVPTLVIIGEAELREGCCGFASRDHRKLRHYAGTSTSTTCSWGIGSPCFWRTTRIPWIASLIFARASACVRPWETHPGSLGHSATM